MISLSFFNEQFQVKQLQEKPIEEAKAKTKAKSLH